MVRLDVDLAQTSCGMIVPLFDYVKDCNQLTRWAAAMGEAGLEDYRRRKNASSLDGFSNGMFEEKNSNS